MRWIFRILINAAALWIAARIVPGIESGEVWWHVFVVGIMFGVVNTVVRPILKIFSIPILILTLGLFIFVINALMLWLTSWLAGVLDLGFHVDGFLAAFLGALVVGFVSFVLSFFVPDEKKEERA